MSFVHRVGTPISSSWQKIIEEEEIITRSPTTWLSHTPSLPVPIEFECKIPQFIASSQFLPSSKFDVLLKCCASYSYNQICLRTFLQMSFSATFPSKLNRFHLQSHLLRQSYLAEFLSWLSVSHSYRVSAGMLVFTAIYPTLPAQL